MVVNWFSSKNISETSAVTDALSNGPRQANLVLIAYASSEGSGEPAHPRSLARTFAARSYKQWVKRNLQTESQIPGPAEWLGMRSWNLSWRNARRHKFAWRGSSNHGSLNSWILKWAASWQNQQNDCAHSEDSDQPGHPPSLIRVFAVRSMGS